MEGLRRLGVQLSDPGTGRQSELIAELQAAGMAQRTMFRQLDEPQLSAIQLSFMRIPEFNSTRHSAFELLQAHEDMLVRRHIGSHQRSLDNSVRHSISGVIRLIALEASFTIALCPGVKGFACNITA